MGLEKRVLLATVLAIFVAGCGGGDDGPVTKTGSYDVEVGRSVIGAPSTSPTQPQDEAVVTYRTPRGVQQTRTIGGKFSTPIWVEDGDALYVSAQRGMGNASVTVKITIEGEDFRKATSYGPASIATASGTCCRR